MFPWNVSKHKGVVTRWQLIKVKRFVKEYSEKWDCMMSEDWEDFREREGF